MSLPAQPINMSEKTREAVFDELARAFVPFQKLFPVSVTECGEEMVDVETFGLENGLAYSALEASTGDKLFLRQSVCERLVQVREALEILRPGSRLMLTYAYRSMAIQVSRFNAMRKELGFGTRSDAEALERTHHFIAVPEIAGHPTGGAIDLLIADKEGKTLDFGTAMHGLERNSYIFSPFISQEAKNNRLLLRGLMLGAGFAPYDGEWWHFSYGDREWAAFYDLQDAFYTQLDEDFTPYKAP